MYNKGIRVSLRLAEKARRELNRIGVSEGRLKIRREGDSIIIPVTEFPDGHDEIEWEECFAEFEARRGFVSDYRKLLEFDPAKMSILPSSYDIIGKKILVKIPAELRKEERNIGEALLEVHRFADSVFRDDGVSGAHRTRNVELIAGRGGTETWVTEYGFRFRLDVRRTFYSPRLAVERKRVSSTVRPDEHVLDMFAGVGPFTIFVAAKAYRGKVMAFDINPYAVSYLRENAVINGMTNIDAHMKDSTLLDFGPDFDRVIMNLPRGSPSFVDKALSMLSEGGVIDYYELVDDISVNSRAEELGNKIVHARVEAVRRVKSYSASSGIYHFLIRKTAPRSRSRA